MKWSGILLAVLASPVGLPGAAPALAIDCGRAGNAIDRAVCASPALLARDTALNDAFAAALARDPSARDRLLQAQRDWLRERGQQCGSQQRAALTACLDRSFARRIAALAPPAAAPALALPAPQPAVPSVTLAAPSPPPDGPAMPEAAARLARSRVPNAGDSDVLLTVERPGRFAIRAESATGLALQLVDMLTGPGEWADGRLDALLDIGTYKLRLRGAEGAAGEATLSVTPFRAAAPVVLRSGDATTATLGDGERRGVWIVIEARRPVRIEAAGRALADLQVWADGRDLVPLATSRRSIEPRRGQPLTALLAEPVLEPGSYLVTAYGGPPRAWANGDTAQPFHFRLDASQAFADGWIAGRIGPFGSEVFEVPRQARQFRLDLPEPAEARLTATTGTQPASASIAANQREPSAWLRLAPRGDAPRMLTVTGQEGQAFALRGFGESGAPTANGGSFLMLAEAAGRGGDNPPAGALLMRREGSDGPLTLLDAAGLRIGPDLAWRGRFNVTQRVRLILQVTASGPIALTRAGVAVTPRLLAVSGENPPGRADGEAATRWDLQAGWYALDLVPEANASGVLDVTLGPPGIVPAAPSATGPADPVLLLGQQTLTPAQRFAVGGEGLFLVARPLPLDLAAAPLTVTLATGQGLDLPVTTPAQGRLRAQALDGSAVEASIVAGPPRQLRVPPAPTTRTLLLSWQRPEAAASLPRPAPPESLPTLAAGAVQRFDLARDQERRLALRVVEGGLYRLETTGRLRTTGRLGTSFLSELDSAEANGVGQNMLMQRYLRAGDYRIVVAARDSAGRLGVQARPATLLEAPALAPGGTARHALAAGEGVVVPITMATAGPYRLDLRSLGRSVRGRLEDAEGWPLLPAGEFSLLEQDFRAGRYRLLIEPADVARRVIARLTDLAEPAPAVGHGPHVLRFGQAASHEWREPAGRDQPRDPDRWRFTLHGPAAVTLELGDGMGAILNRGATRVAGFAGRFESVLEAGQYEIEARATGRNDRLTYSLSLESAELQPDTPRNVELPATIPFTIAEDRVVSLSSFGGTALRAVLRDAAEREVARDEGNAADWNLSLSRRLPAGRYLLGLSTIDAVPPLRARRDNSEAEEGEEADRGSPEREMGDSDGGPGEASVELRLSLPPSLPERAIAFDGSAHLTEAGVHLLPLSAVAPESLLLARTSASEPIVLSLERRIGDAPWRAVATEAGRAPFLAVPGEAGASWRLVTWAEAGGATPIEVAARVVAPTPQAGASVTPETVEGMPGFAVALVTLEAETALTLSDPALRSGSAAGRALAVADTVLPQSRRLWLLGTGTAPVTLTPLGADPAIVTLLPGETATLPAIDTPRLWIAGTGGAPAWLEAGRGMGLAEGSVLALAAGRPLRLRGDAAAATRVTLRHVAPTLAPPRRVEGAALALTLPPGTAQPLILPEGPRQMRFDLAPGTAAILGWQGTRPLTVWAGEAAVSRVAAGVWPNLLLVNTGEAPAPVGLTLAPAAAPMRVANGRPLRRFPGTSGSLAIPVEGRAGQRLFWTGASGQFIGVDGVVTTAPGMRLAGAGQLVLTHAAGPVLAWLDDDLMPTIAAEPQALPARRALTGEAMALVLDPGGPVLLRASTSAPVVLALGDAAPEAFGGGAELQRYLPGAATLRLVSPHEGPLTGTLTLTATPVTPASEGVGEAVMVAPGGTALFGFTLARAGTIGIGLRATPDRVALRVLDATGAPLGEGVAQLRDLPAGSYLLEARVPPDAGATAIRPALIGLTPRPDGPPDAVIGAFQAEAGITPVAAPR